MTSLVQVMEEFAAVTPGFLSASVVNRADGTSLASVSARPELDPEAADAYFTAMLERHERALKALGLHEETEDMSLTTSEALFLVRALPHTRYFWVVVTARRNSLGLVRELMRKHQAKVTQALP